MTSRNLLETLCNPTDRSTPGSSVHGILQARILERLPFPSPGDLPDPGVESGSLALQAEALPTEPPGKPHLGTGSNLLLCVSPKSNLHGPPLPTSSEQGLRAI